MFPRIWSLVGRWSSSVRTPRLALILHTSLAILFGALVGGFLAYNTTTQSGAPLIVTPPFSFQDGESTIEASGTLRSLGSAAPNAAHIFCWLPENTCDLTIAELVPQGPHEQFRVVQKLFDITQLSDATLTAISDTDPCQAATLRIDRQTRAVSLSVTPTIGAGGRAQRLTSCPIWRARLSSCGRAARKT